MKDAWTQGLAANLVGILAIAGWTACWSVMIFLPLRLVGVLRATNKHQDSGLDAAKHTPDKAYFN